MRRALLCLVLVASPASAQEPRAPNAEGEYGGVQPGQAKKPEPTKKAKKPPPKGTLSWIGFEAKDGGSQVFFQSVAPFQVTQRVENGTVVVTLSGLARLGHNTWRPIDTRFFDTPIARVTAKKKGRAIEVRIAFKNAKDAAPGSVRTATEADGMFYAYLTFAGGGAGAAGGGAAPSEPER
jgi:hypothetical protein